MMWGMFRFGVLIFVIVQCANCGFFDLTDIDDPFIALWNNRDAWLQQSNGQTCIGSKSDGTKVSGVCKKASKCILSGGIPAGICGGLQACCSYESVCDKTTKAKVSYFDNGDQFNDITTCKYTVQLANPNICQVRLDFERFDILPATLARNNTQILCNDDKLIIYPNNYGIPVLCGYNTGQHVYIHINQTDGEKNDVVLRFEFREREGDPSLVDPTWKIKVTQLECPGLKYSWFQHSDEKQLARDFNMLAPTGAIQYFTEPSGYIRSFGYNPAGKKNSYTSGEDYAIAFRRHKTTCGVRFTKDYFNLHYTAPDTTTEGVPRDPSCEDYLFVPELKVETTMTPTSIARVCGRTRDPTRLNFTSTPPGPLNVNFHSAVQYEDPTNLRTTWAFNIKYNLMSGC